MDSLLIFFKQMNQLIWGIPMIVILMGTHLFFTFKTGFIQKLLPKAIRLSVTPEKEVNGDLNAFASLATTLAATIGTGNIVGVSTAVALGGPGAVFWCWLTGFFGMATSYAECYLGVKYRKKTADGTYLGGPMYVLQDGLHKKGLAVFFSLCILLASFGVGCSTQSNSITCAAFTLFHLSPRVVAFLTALLIGLVIIGGIKKIGSVCMKLVPAMSFLYIAGCIIVLICNRDYIVKSLLLIFKSAFLPCSVAGGLIGGSLQKAARYGVARGLFTNEAGMGSAAITAASAKTKTPSRQALISMTAAFWDTVVMCAITGIVIVTNLIRFPESIQGISYGDLTSAAFGSVSPAGKYILGISLIAFACATLLGWSYMGEKAADYLFGKKGIGPYRVTYIVMIFVGGILSLDLVWELSDFINALVVIPNLIALYGLYKIIPDRNKCKKENP